MRAIVPPLVKGLITWVPGVREALGYDFYAAGGTGSAQYCYGVWLKHLTLLWQSGMRTIPRNVVEFGPRASLGTGLAAYLCGAERYTAIDVVRHASEEKNAAVFQELISLFGARAPRPKKGWPDFDSELDERLFPSHILTEQRLAASLAPTRVARVADAIRYVHWMQIDGLPPGEAELIFSHVVLCHLSDLDEFYALCARLIRPGGWMSHQTSFTSRSVTREWSGHRRYGELMWNLIKGRRPFFVSREVWGEHVALLERHGFELVKVQKMWRRDGIAPEAHAERWRRMPEDDLYCAEVFFTARKAI